MGPARKQAGAAGEPPQARSRAPASASASASACTWASQASGPACPGFTLLETLAALAIVALLVMVAAPSWGAWQQRRQLQAEAEALWSSLALARAQALMRQQRVTLCPSAGGLACEPSDAAQGAWHVGWLVFEDRNRNGVREADEPVLQQRAASPRGVQIIGRSTLSQSIAYGADGGSEGVHGQFLAGTVLLCAPGQSEGWQLVLNALGRARLAKVAVPSCP